MLGRTQSPKTVGASLFVNGRVHIVPDGTSFFRGDSNGDDSLDLSDAQYMLDVLFLGGERPTCPDAADANDDGHIDISDPVAPLQCLFLGGPSLPPPFRLPGLDPTPDGLSCESRKRFAFEKVGGE